MELLSFQIVHLFVINWMNFAIILDLTWPRKYLVKMCIIFTSWVQHWWIVYFLLILLRMKWLEYWNHSKMVLQDLITSMLCHLKWYHLSLLNHLLIYVTYPSPRECFLVNNSLPTCYHYIKMMILMYSMIIDLFRCWMCYQKSLKKSCTIDWVSRNV